MEVFFYLKIDLNLIDLLGYYKFNYNYNYRDAAPSLHSYAVFGSLSSFLRNHKKIYRRAVAPLVSHPKSVVDNLKDKVNHFLLECEKDKKVSSNQLVFFKDNHLMHIVCRYFNLNILKYIRWRF